MLFKASPYKKLSRHAHNLIRLSKKVVAYRKDILSQADCKDILRHQQSAQDALHAADNNRLKQATKELDKVLKKHGGKIYPVTFWSENVEMFLVAAILAIGIRSFFFQPFKIPTNSMYPTYSGMVPHIYQEEEQPSLAKRTFNLITKGASHYNIQSPQKGHVRIPLFNPNDPISGLGRVKFKQVKGRKWFGLLPSYNREYTLYVDNEPVSFEVPWDFSLDEVIHQAFFPEYESIDAVYRMQKQYTPNTRAPILTTSKQVQPQESVLCFDILSGDTLFVNRFIYHFKQPQIGEAIIFPTRNIPGLQNPDGTPYEDKYYIKRLVGLPGDTLEIKAPVLYRNESPIEGAEAFDLNAQQKGLYPGYTAVRHLKPGRKVHIGENEAYGMGDNSPHSGDSRYWGPLPKKDIIGRSAFIFYPFTERFGLTK